MPTDDTIKDLEQWFKEICSLAIKMTRTDRLKKIRKTKTPILERRRDRVQAALEVAEDQVNHLRAYVEDMDWVLHERKEAANYLSEQKPFNPFEEMLKK